MTTASPLDSPLTKFPAGFLWGTATASYQIEGATEVDGRGPCIWDTFARHGGVLNGDNGDIACDHYHRLEEDLDLLSELGVDAYRFSVAWPRIQATGSGPANTLGLDFYRRLIDGLRQRNISPVATLYHWDLPQELQDRGGWVNRDTALRFAEYAALVGDALGDGVDKWITVNEPWCVSWLGYGAGHHAPGHHHIGEAAAANHHVLLAHGLALAALRSTLPHAEVGITLNLSVHQPASAHELDVLAAQRASGNLNGLFLDPVFRGAYPEPMLEHYSAHQPGFSVIRDGDLGHISAPIDFLGVNYYSAYFVADASRVDEARASGFNVGPPSTNPFDVDLAAVPVGVPTRSVTAMGWEVEPSGLTELLVSLRRDYTELPIFITENGAAYQDYVDPLGAVHDTDRVNYIDAHVAAVHDAITQGVNVQGYFVWSLLDNFEWAFGYSQRFGIVWVDFPSGTRTPKDSFHRYAHIIAAHHLASVPAGEA